RDPLPVGRGGPDPRRVDEDLPRRGDTPVGDQGLPHGAPALPGGPLQDPAPAAHQVPRDRRGLVLRRPDLLAGPARPDAGGERGAVAPPAALLSVARHAAPGGAGLLAHLD